MAQIEQAGNLRASHFQLGNTSQPNQFVSTSKMAFQKAGEVAAQSSLGEKLNVKASHFELGDHRNNYITSFKSHYPAHQNVESAQLNEEKKHDLRTNHFVLGHQDGNRQSITKQTYNTKPIQANILHEQEAQKAKMRAHHHNFAETQAKMMQTQYNHQYQGYSQEFLHQSKTREELMERVVGLRQSHIILGKEKLPMHSIQQIDFNQKHAEQSKAVKVPPQQSHFAFGQESSDYKTVNQEFLTKQPIEKNEIVEENQQNLRATHFSLGQDGQPYLSETKGNFRPYTQNPIEFKNNTRALQSNHFEIGDSRNQKGHFQTQYNAAMKPPQAPLQQSAMRDQKQDRGSNFVIGTMPIPYQSEFGANFGKGSVAAGKPASLDSRLMKDLRSSHFKFNDVQSNQFKTTSGQAFGKTNGNPNQLDPNSEANLRSHHFNMGQGVPHYISTTHDTHRPINGRPNQLNAQLARDLRSHHFALN